MQRVTESLKKELNPDTPLTVHRDGKLIKDTTGHKTVDPLSILGLVRTGCRSTFGSSESQSWNWGGLRFNFL